VREVPLRSCWTDVRVTKSMHTLNEIEALLRGIEGELRQNIVRSLGSSTVALLALYDDHGQEKIIGAGSGTLVVDGDAHYILTAAHVWEYVNSKPRLGITLAENIDHRTPIEIPTIVPTVLKPEAKLSSVTEWGPDIALLRIPSELVGGIKAFKLFEDLNAPPKHLHAASLECWFVIGAPGELATFTEKHAELQILGQFAAPQEHEHGGYDYFDFQLDSTSPGMPKSWGGLSGGGLWRVLVYSSPETGKIDWAKRLKGVPFYQFPVQNGCRIIRAHGSQSIAAVAREARGVPAKSA
jgi:hypothetical protein